MVPFIFYALNLDVPPPPSETATRVVVSAAARVWTVPQVFVVESFRDRDVYEQIKALLIGTGEFGDPNADAMNEAVRIGKPEHQARYRSNDLTWANIQPLTNTSRDDGSPEREFHKASFLLSYGIRAHASDAAEDTYQSELDRMDAVIRNTLMSPANRTFGGRCLSAETRLTEGSIVLAGWPGMSRAIRGEFAYTVSFPAGGYSVTR